MIECKICKYFPCIRGECELYYGRCEIGKAESSIEDYKEIIKDNLEICV